MVESPGDADQQRCRLTAASHIIRLSNL